MNYELSVQFVKACIDWQPPDLHFLLYAGFHFLQAFFKIFLKKVKFSLEGLILWRN